MPAVKRISKRIANAAKAVVAAVSTTIATTESTDTVTTTRVIAPKGRARKAVTTKKTFTVKEEVVKEEAVVFKDEGGQNTVPLIEAPGAAQPSTAELIAMEQEMQTEIETVVQRKRKAPATIAPKKPKKVAVPKEPKPEKEPKAKKKVKPKKERKPKKAPVIVDVADRCPDSVSSRLKRVLSQRMFLVDREREHDLRETFSMLGSTANVYTITIAAHQNRCNCPDFIMHNNPCKHLLFIFVKVFHIPTTSDLIYQRSFNPQQLQSIFENAPPPPADVMVDPRIRAAFRGETVPKEGSTAATAPDGTPLRREPAEGDDCPVCYSEMETTENLEYCETVGGCGRPLHAECFEMWSATSTRKGQQVSCVWCRTPWKGTVRADKGKGRAVVIAGASTSTEFYRTYTNMSALVGMSSKRDTSSYRR